MTRTQVIEDLLNAIDCVLSASIDFRSVVGAGLQALGPACELGAGAIDGVGS